MEMRMNVFTVTGRIVDKPTSVDSPGGHPYEFRLAVDGQPWLDLTIRADDHTLVPGGQILAGGCQVKVVAVIRHDDWLVRDGVRPDRWRAHATAITVLDGIGDTAIRSPRS
jgi:hypothetical protein